MNAGPLRRLLGALGLLALAPIGWLLATGALAPVEAAVRAVVTLVVVVTIGRIATAWLSHVASRLESAPADTADGGATNSA